MGFVTFMASAAGRLLRIVAGLIIIGIGVYLFQGNGVAGVIVTVVGLVPLLAGIFDVCVFAPFFSCPFQGSKVRQQAH
ncbi:MAG: hypothetical protein PVS3B3_35160 [Ktedonobacteraceae bacterium]